MEKVLRELFWAHIFGRPYRSNGTIINLDAAQTILRNGKKFRTSNIITNKLVPPIPNKYSPYTMWNKRCCNIVVIDFEQVLAYVNWLPQAHSESSQISKPDLFVKGFLIVFAKMSILEKFPWVLNTPLIQPQFWVF